MTSITIKDTNDKPCTICMTTEKVVEADFADKTFKGTVCMTHLWHMIVARSGKKNGNGQGTKAAGIRDRKSVEVTS